MEPAFKIYFNKNKQWLEIYLHDIHPNTFERKGGGRWGYFDRTWDNPRRGKFGEIHLVKSRVRDDLISHELLHAVFEWYFSRNLKITRRNEERICEFQDELVRKFYREYRKVS